MILDQMLREIRVMYKEQVYCCEMALSRGQIDRNNASEIGNRREWVSERKKETESKMN